MSFPSNQDEFPNVCPYLGLADDADSHATYATEAHRCYRLETPTRIATNHQESFCLGANHPTCPVFRGEGVASTTSAVAPTPLDRGPRGKAPREQTPREPKAPRSAGATAERPARPGSLNPRPRTGGISMPVLTIGLFVLAGVVIALAFWIQSVVGGDDNSAISPADVSRSQLAASRTNTAANTTTTTPRPGTPTVTTGTQTGTPRTGTPATTTTTPTNGAKTYTVVDGDNCGIIADDNNTTVEQIQALNPTINADCTNLEVGQVIKLP